MKWIVASAYFLASVASAHAANQHTTKILGLTQAQQNQFFTLVLKKESCDRVNRTMYQGGTSDGDDSWSVGCENGNDFSVGIPTDIKCSKNTDMQGNGRDRHHARETGGSTADLELRLLD